MVISRRAARFSVVKKFCSACGLTFPINFSSLKPFYQFIGLDIHQLHLTGPVKYMVGNSLIDGDPRNGRDQVIQRFQVLYIYRCINIDPSLEEFLHILIPLGVPAPLGIIVGQFIHQNQLRLTLQSLIEIKLPKLDAPVVDHLIGQDLQSRQQGQCVWSCVRFHVSHHNINALCFCLMRCFQHCISLTHTSCITEKNFQSPLLSCLFRIIGRICEVMVPLVHAHSPSCNFP